MHQMEKKLLNGLLFRCQHDECTEKIPYGKYFAHLRIKCQVKKHKKVQLPEAATFANQQIEDNNPYRDIFVVGDLNKLFLEKGDYISHDLEAQNRQAHDHLYWRLRGNDEEYGDEDDYGDYGEEE